MKWIWLAAGGALGAGSRYFFQQVLAGVMPGYPLGTFTANFLGSLVIGFLVPHMTDMNPRFQIFLVTGYLGALTTLSSYVMEVMVMAQEKRWLAAVTHWAGGSLICLLGCVIGYWLGSRLVAA